MLGKKLKILVSRTDAIGDVILTIPICDILKENIEVSELHFLGRSYTEDVIQTCSVIDKFVNIDLLEKLDYAAQVQSLKDENYDAIIHVLPNQDRDNQPLVSLDDLQQARAVKQKKI
jgi:heptosyltransferase-3